MDRGSAGTGNWPTQWTLMPPMDADAADQRAMQSVRQTTIIVGAAATNQLLLIAASARSAASDASRFPNLSEIHHEPVGFSGTVGSGDDTGQLNALEQLIAPA